MDNDKISFAVFEGACARLERTIKRLWVLAIVLMVLFVGTNALWILYEMQFEDVTTAVQQEADWDKGDVIINGTGGIKIDGESKADSND